MKPVRRGILKLIGTRSLAFGRTESDWDGTRVVNMEVQNDEILWAGSRQSAAMPCVYENWLVA